MIGGSGVFGPRLFGDRDFAVSGQVAVVEPRATSRCALRDGHDARGGRMTAVAELVERARAGGAGDAVLEALGSRRSSRSSSARPTRTSSSEKAWLLVEDQELRISRSR